MCLSLTVLVAVNVQGLPTPECTLFLKSVFILQGEEPPQYTDLLRCERHIKSSKVN